MKLQQRRAAKFKPDDHSEVVPLLPIPNRTVKHLSADDSADSRVKVGHRQANKFCGDVNEVYIGQILRYNISLVLFKN